MLKYSWIQFLKLFFSKKKGIIFFNKYPSPQNLKDGYSQRIKVIDDTFISLIRIYIDKDYTHYVIEAVDGKYNKFRLKFSMGVLSKALYIFLLSTLVLRFKCVYSHSVFSLLHPVYRMLFKLSRRRTFDFHGAVPEESEMIKNNSHSFEKLTFCERFAVKKANVIIGVSQAMINHIQKKYSLQEQSKAFIIVPTCKQKQDSSLEIESKDLNLVVYCGGLQPWQQIEKMLSYVNQHKMRFTFIFITPLPQQIQEIYFKLFNEKFPGKLITAAHEEVFYWYKKAAYGLIFRENKIVNNIACPTKLIEYIQNGILPIVDSPIIGDFLKSGYQYLSYQSEEFPAKALWKKMVNKNYQVAKDLDEEFMSGLQLLKQSVKT